MTCIQRKIVETLLDFKTAALYLAGFFSGYYCMWKLSNKQDTRKRALIKTLLDDVQGILDSP